MTIDMRHEIGKKERLALAVLGFGSLFTLCVGYAMMLYQNKTIGFVVISVSGFLLLVVLIVNSLHYTNPRTYNRIVLLFNPNAVLREETVTRPVGDSPPSYKKSWARAFQQRTNDASSSESYTVGAEGGPLPVDLERHLDGRVGVEDRGNGRSERRKKKDGKRSHGVGGIQRTLEPDQELQEEEDGNSPPPFEVAILELSAKELEKINESLPQSRFISTSETVEMEEEVRTVMGQHTDLFTVQQEYRRGNDESKELRTSTVNTIYPVRKSEIEVAPVHSPQTTPDTTPTSNDVSSLQDDQGNLRVVLVNGRLTEKPSERSGCVVQKKL